MSLLLQEKVAGVSLTDEESFLVCNTSSTADAVPLPPLGKALYAKL